MRNLNHALRQPCRIAGLALLLAAATGCGARTTYPVRGKVVFKDGTPLTGGLVVFRPVDEKLQVSARGDIQHDGSFILSTYHEGDGAVPGKYQAAITPPPRRKIREKPVEKPIVDPRFESYDTSGLEFEVKRESNNFKIEVDKP
jgi:hypothetical protein